jgi:hypothetical protein
VIGAGGLRAARGRHVARCRSPSPIMPSAGLCRTVAIGLSFPKICSLFIRHSLMLSPRTLMQWREHDYVCVFQSTQKSAPFT